MKCIFYNFDGLGLMFGVFVNYKWIEIIQVFGLVIFMNIFVCRWSSLFGVLFAGLRMKIFEDY